MKLIFDTITLGGGPNFYLDDNFPGLDGNLENITVRIPRSDYSKDIADYLLPKVRGFSGTLVGDDQTDFRDRKKDFSNRLRQSYTFQLVDDYTNADGSITIYETYQFEGKLIEVKVNDDHRSNMSKYQIQIFSTDPLLYSDTEISESCEIHERGFVFPLVFPFIFTGVDNTIVVDNIGAVDVYPTITIHGAGTNFKIINETTDLDDNVFEYNATLAGDEEIVITPNPTDPIKVRKNGISVLSLTNGNFEALKLVPGINTFTFFLDSGEDGSTGTTLSFRPAWLGI